VDGNKSSVAPKQLLSVGDGIFLTIGMIVGALIFKAPSTVAGATSSNAEFLFAWLLGGLVSLCGALVYAELAARHPDVGGEYMFLRRGWGHGVAFVFAWSRMTVIQTGAIAAVAFVFGDYASEIISLGKGSSAIWAALAVVVLTLLNLAGTLHSKTLQKVMEITLITGLVLFAVAGLMATGTPKPAAAGSTSLGQFGFAMIFVLLAFGGWNEAAYLAGEVRDGARNMVRILVWGVLGVTVLYLVVNLAYLAVLGHGGVKESKAVAADVMRVIAGDKGAALLALLVCVSVLTTMNAAIFTGARTSYALGRDFRFFGRLGAWRESGSTPAVALVVQGVIALLLVGASAMTPDGFSAMVAYTSPVFWTFFLLTALTLFIYRRREEGVPSFRVPLYPVVPILFCLACLWMLYSSINYVRFAVQFGAPVLAGLAIMALGIPLYWFARSKTEP
jgi:basic amino acid/polyamine antiporter, APA family